MGAVPFLLALLALSWAAGAAAADECKANQTCIPTREDYSINVDDVVYPGTADRWVKCRWGWRPGCCTVACCRTLLCSAASAPGRSFRALAAPRCCARPCPPRSCHAAWVSWSGPLRRGPYALCSVANCTILPANTSDLPLAECGCVVANKSGWFVTPRQLKYEPLYRRTERKCFEGDAVNNTNTNCTTTNSAPVCRGQSVGLPAGCTPCAAAGS